MNYKKIGKNAKALSPVVASIILIAVTVAVSVVVAAWMGGMTIGLMGNAEQVAITNTQNVNSTSVSVSVQNTGAATATIVSATIDGKPVTFSGINSVGSPSTSITKGTTSVFTLQQSSPFTSTAQYVIKLQTAKGNVITYTYTYTGP